MGRHPNGWWEQDRSGHNRRRPQSSARQRSLCHALRGENAWIRSVPLALWYVDNWRLRNQDQVPSGHPVRIPAAVISSPTPSRNWRSQGSLPTLLGGCTTNRTAQQVHCGRQKLRNLSRGKIWQESTISWWLGWRALSSYLPLRLSTSIWKGPVRFRFQRRSGVRKRCPWWPAAVEAGTTQVVATEGEGRPVTPHVSQKRSLLTGFNAW